MKNLNSVGFCQATDSSRGLIKIKIMKMNKPLSAALVSAVLQLTNTVAAAEPEMAMQSHGMSQEGMQQHSGMMHKRFDDPERLAKNFDNPERNAWQKPEQVIESLNLSPTTVIADIGAGTGYFSTRLAKRLPKGKVLAADIEPNMVAYLAERAKRDKLNNMLAVQAGTDNANLPEKVDVALFVNSYHLIADRVEYFKKLQQSLNAEGRLAIVDWKMNVKDTPPKMRLLPFMTALNELSQAGYELIELRDFLPRQYIAIYKKATQPEPAMGVGMHGHMMHGEHSTMGHMQHGDGAYHHSFSDAEKWAKQFDDPERDSWQLPEKVFEILKLDDDAIVADIGAGTGYFSTKLAKHLNDGKVIAVDAEPDMVRYLQGRIAKESLKNVQVVLGGGDTPYLPEPVDLVLLVDVYHHIGNRVDYFKQLANALKKNGRIAVIDFREAGPGTPPAEHIVKFDQANDELTKAGYQLLERHEFLPKQYIAIFGR